MWHWSHVFVVNAIGNTKPHLSECKKYLHIMSFNSFFPYEPLHIQSFLSLKGCHFLSNLGAKLSFCGFCPLLSFFGSPLLRAALICLCLCLQFSYKYVCFSREAAVASGLSSMGHYRYLAFWHAEVYMIQSHFPGLYLKTFMNLGEFFYTVSTESLFVKA